MSEAFLQNYNRNNGFQNVYSYAQPNSQTSQNSHQPTISNTVVSENDTSPDESGFTDVINHNGEKEISIWETMDVTTVAIINSTFNSNEDKTNGLYKNIIQQFF